MTTKPSPAGKPRSRITRSGLCLRASLIAVMASAAKQVSKWFALRRTCSPRRISGSSSTMRIFLFMATTPREGCGVHKFPDFRRHLLGKIFGWRIRVDQVQIQQAVRDRETETGLLNAYKTFQMVFDALCPKFRALLVGRSN